MRANKKIMLLLISLPLIFLLSGCPPPQGSSVPKRFQESAPQSQTPVESAIELAKKHAKLSDEMVVLRQKNQDLIAENRHLKDQLGICETQLQQAQKELAQANDLLIEMRIELNNWKTDILGFREEMRDAEKAQLEALFQILTVLGGEVKPESDERNE